MQALCANPSPDALSAAQSAFVAVVAAWGKVEPIRFGPIAEENRLERILYWPDRKSIGLKQVQAALADQDASVTDAAQAQAKERRHAGIGRAGVRAVRNRFREPGRTGRPAPLRLRSGGRAKRRGHGEGGTRIAWQAPDGISRQWATPGADNPLYRSDDEAMTELFNVFVHGLEMIRDVRLNGFLGDEPGGDKPKQAIFWRSEATAVSLGANIDGLQGLFEASKLAGKLPSDSAWIADSINFEFNTAERMLGTATGPIADVLGGERRGGLQAVPPDHLASVGALRGQSFRRIGADGRLLLA